MTELTRDDGRRGLLSADAIIWPDGTRSSLSARPSVIIVPLDNPNAPNKIRCAVLDGASYCY